MALHRRTLVVSIASSSHNRIRHVLLSGRGKERRIPWHGGSGFGESHNLLQLFRMGIPFPLHAQAARMPRTKSKASRFASKGSQLTNPHAAKLEMVCASSRRTLCGQTSLIKFLRTYGEISQKGVWCKMSCDSKT